MESNPKLWVMRQTWRDLLFAHWPVPVRTIRDLVPQPLELDTWDGTAWIAVVPFLMTGIRGRWLPPLPGLTRSLELNVRTYVKFRDQPAVYFFSLDAGNAALVGGARLTYGLPYYRARMSWSAHRYQSRRTHRNAPAANLTVGYAPIGPVYQSQARSLEEFLTERYWLMTVHRGRVSGAPIWHERWPLQHAEAEFEDNTMTDALGIRLDGPPLLHFARAIDVRIGAARPLFP